MDAEAAAPTPALLEAESQAEFASPEADEGEVQEVARDLGRSDAQDLAVAPARTPASDPKVDDPLAHHVFIPTLRLRPGQVSWGPISELGGGFFLEVPLPREIDAGEAEVLITPEGLRPKSERRREGLRAETRALEALAGNESGGDDLPREFLERLPVEALQRSLILQIPPDVLGVGRYRVDLEIRSEGAVAGRGRFRLELQDE